MRRVREGQRKPRLPLNRMNRMGEKTAARLTVRETEVAVWLGRGVEPVEIARRMGISYHTVRTHIVHARERAGARTSAQLAVMVAVQRERDRVRLRSASFGATSAPLVQ